MARRVGPAKVRQYSLEFKLKAVKVSQLKGVEVQAVADALEIHPFMLSRWRKAVPSPPSAPTRDRATRVACCWTSDRTTPCGHASSR